MPNDAATFHEAEASSLSPTIPPHSPYFLHASDQPGTPLVTPLLNGDNFPTWHHARIIALQAKNKLQFLDGSLRKPASTSFDLPHWIRCNSMVCSWIVHSIIPTITHNILWINSTRDAWLDLQTHFSLKKAPQIFEIRRSISNLYQGLDSIFAYYTKLKGLCDEFSSYRALPTCTCGSATTIRGFYDSDLLMDFLQGLHDSYSVVRSQILLMDPLPSFAKVYSLLLQEELQRSIHSLPTPPIDHAAMALDRSKLQSQRPKPFYHYDFCSKDGHSKARCFKKHGFPDNKNPKNYSKDINTNRSNAAAQRGSTSNMPSNLAAAISTGSTILTSGPTLSADQIQQLLALLPVGNSHPLEHVAGPTFEDNYYEG
ncbi:uncharacterized protein LOC122668419 [Telopea speciosissima]|uniref:uncharacterized protein LOC122668419 n=1 Tax=Telopea speciosissima TaxID=54955 RepID=UPI001CC3A127|nr:uncharacterized protein LOC122668419 [Telopea speciosissima]